MSVLDKTISYFPSTTESRNGVSVNLLTLLQSTKHCALITDLRAESDPVKQGKIKDGLPCYTVAGTFSRRCEDGLLLPSGLAAVDLDSAEDYDVLPLLHELRKIPYIAYAGLSCRGKRLFAIIPFLHPDKYSKQYERLIKSFEDIGLPMGDTCHKSISQPRYISYNTVETCFYNHNAKLYHLLPPEKIHNSVSRTITVSDNNSQPIPDNPFKWCETQFLKSHSFDEGGRHKYIIGLARYCNIKGLPESDTLSACIANYTTEGFDDLEISKIVRHIYSSQSASHNTNPFKPITQGKNKNSKKAVSQIPPTPPVAPSCIPVATPSCHPAVVLSCSPLVSQSPLPPSFYPQIPTSRNYPTPTSSRSQTRLLRPRWSPPHPLSRYSRLNIIPFINFSRVIGISYYLSEKTLFSLKPYYNRIKSFAHFLYSLFTIHSPRPLPASAVVSMCFFLSRYLPEKANTPYELFSICRQYCLKYIFLKKSANK